MAVLSDYKRGDEVQELYWHMLKTLPGEDDLQPIKTCHKIFIQEANRLGRKIQIAGSN